MCDFFSFTSDGKANFKYFNAELRKKVKNGELRYNPDSHTSINDYYGFRGILEDDRNKYEFNPITGNFNIDQTNTSDDSKEAETWVRELDFKTVIPELVIKPIINPFEDVIFEGEITEKQIELLKQWIEVRSSVRSSVWDSVRDSAWNSVWNSVRSSVLDSVWSSVWSSVRSSVWNSIWDFAHAYTSSFFHLEKWKYIEHTAWENPFQPVIDLWEMGLIPSYDGNVWRLHSGTETKVVYELSAK